MNTQALAGGGSRARPALRPLVLRGVVFDPPLFCAPMAGITHSAFRRLLAGFGGYGAVYTEMLSARSVLVEDPLRSPWLRRRPEEGRVVYQLFAVEARDLPRVVDRLLPLAPDALDLNSACPAPAVRQQGGGGALFDDAVRLRDIVKTLRASFAGPLTVKIRLGRRTPEWRAALGERLRMLAGEGVDALIVHPRFAEDRLRRVARHELYAELAAEAALPIIANGDITGAGYWAEREARFRAASGLMIGRLAAAQPWCFARWHNPDMAEPDHAAVWSRLFDYIVEDFPPVKALARVKIVTAYFARNFTFGHTLFAAVQSAPDLKSARERGLAFLAAHPSLLPYPSFDGV